MGPSLKWHVANIVAVRPNPQPHDDILYKDSIWHSSRVITCLLNIKPLRNRQKTNRRQKPEDGSQTMQCPELLPTTILPNDQSAPCPMGGINRMPIPKRSSWLSCRLQLSWLPVNGSFEGDRPSCCIMIDIMLENIYILGIHAGYSIRSTAPTSWSVVITQMQPLGSYHGVCIVFATVPDSLFRSGSRSERRHCQVGGPGHQSTRAVISGMVRWITPNQSELGRLSACYPAGPSVNSFNALPFLLW